MKKGFTKAWRKELLSDIWLMPPLYFKVWYYLRQKAQHEPFLFPTPKGYGIWVLPGQRLTSLQEIADGVKWSEWGREVVPNKKTIDCILKWLVDEEMIIIESNAKGTLISIINWDTYNHVDELESNAQETDSIPRSGHKKRMLKNVEETKDKTYTLEDGRILTQREFFELLWKAYPKKEDKPTAYKRFCSSVKSDKDADRINAALAAYLAMLDENKDWRKPQGGCVWFGKWEGWIPEGYDGAAKYDDTS